MISSADGGERDARGHDTGSDPVAHDRRALRRALLAGGVVAGLSGLLFMVLLAAAGGRGVAVAIMFGLAAGGLVASLWSLAAIALDVIVADHQPGVRRLVGTGGLVVATFVIGVFALGASAV